MGIVHRLRIAQKKGKLSIVDLANWLDTNKGTMRSWLGGVEPSATRKDLVEERLDWLEKAIDEGVWFPVPLSVTQFARKDYVVGARNAVSSRVSKPRPSR